MKNNVAAHFDILSSKYLAHFSDIKSGTNHEFHMRRELTKNIAAGQTGFLLDCACGTGEIAATALQSGCFQHAVLADFSKEMLTFAKRFEAAGSINGKIEYREIDIFEYKPEKDMKFDLILCLGLVAHTGRLEDLLYHLKSMLRPHGKIVLQSSLANHLFVRLDRWLHEKKRSVQRGYNISYFTKQDIEQVCDRVGLAVVDVLRHRFGLPFGDRISPLGNYWIEKMAQPFAKTFGTEAIFVLAQKS